MQENGSINRMIVHELWELGAGTGSRGRPTDATMICERFLRNRRFRTTALYVTANV
jgi:hypothetical protein